MSGLRWSRRLAPGMVVILMAFVLFLPPGENRGSDYSGHWDEERQEYVHEKEERVLGTTTGRILGQFTFQVLLVSLLFAYPRPLPIDGVLRSRFHRGLGITILVLASAHAAVLLPNLVFRGWLTGVVSFLVLAAHGFLGAAKKRVVARWGGPWWRHLHRTTGWAGLFIGIQHALVYGQHYGLLREAVLGP